MVIKNENLNSKTTKNAFGGIGEQDYKEILPLSLLEPMGRVLGIVTIPPSSTTAYHSHEGENEVYHILSGEGLYNDNGKEVLVKKGDTAFCQSGQGHGIKNIGDSDLVFLAFIFYTKD